MAITPDSKFLLTTDTIGVLKLWKDLEELPPESAPASPNVTAAPSLTESLTTGISAEPADDSESLIMLMDDSHDMGVTGADFSQIHETSGRRNDHLIRGITMSSFYQKKRNKNIKRIFKRLD